MAQHPPPDGVQVRTYSGYKNPMYLCHQVIGEKFALLSRILIARMEGVPRVVDAEACIQPQVEEKNAMIFSITNLEICSSL